MNDRSRTEGNFLTGVSRSWERTCGHQYSLVFECDHRVVLRRIVPTDTKTQYTEYQQYPPERD